MFDIGFTELLLIGIVALLVVGPEKLPSVIRTGLQYFRQFKSGVAHIRDEVERELAVEDIKKEIDGNKSELSNALGYDDLHESLDELRQEANSLYDVRDWQTEHDSVTDAEIEADLSALEDEMGPKLPDADRHADTGVETTPTQRKVQTSKKQQNKAKSKSEKSKTDKKTKKKKTKAKPQKKTPKVQDE